MCICRQRPTKPICHTFEDLCVVQIFPPPDRQIFPRQGREIYGNCHWLVLQNICWEISLRKTEEEIVGGLSGKGRRLINSDRQNIFVKNCMNFGRNIKMILTGKDATRSEEQNWSWTSTRLEIDVQGRCKKSTPRILTAGVRIIFTDGTGVSYRRW